MTFKTSPAKRLPAFHPIVLDENGMLRRRFNALKAKTKIEKRALASKIFETGLTIIERSDAINIAK